MWTQVSRKADSLKRAKETSLKQAGITLEEDHPHQYNRFDHVVTMMRRIFRSKCYTSRLLASRSITSLSGTALALGLCNIVHDARKTYELYKEDYVLSGKFGAQK